MNRHILEGPWFAACTSGLGHIVATEPPNETDAGYDEWSPDVDWHMVCHCSTRLRGSTAEALTALISAAPEMRAELIKVCGKCRPTSQKGQCRSCSIRTVLRKARGLLK